MKPLVESHDQNNTNELWLTSDTVHTHNSVNCVSHMHAVLKLQTNDGEHKLDWNLNFYVWRPVEPVFILLVVSELENLF